MSGTPPRSQEQNASDERGATQRRGHPTRQRRRVGRLDPTRSHFQEEVRASSVAALNRCLADATVVHSQLKFAHWNVKGPDFYQLHGLFDDLAATLEAHVDAMAERAVALGGQALGTVRLAAHSSEVPAISTRDVDAPAMVEQVADNLAPLDATLFEEIRAAEGRDDLATADLLSEVSRDVTAALGFLEAHLQGRETAAAGAGDPPVRGPTAR